jgi:ferredoxin
MSNLEVIIRETAARLLREGQVAVVLGYEAGSVPFRTAPAFIERAEGAERLVWNRFCTNNLATYLPKLKGAGRIALFAKGCDARSAITLIQEHQIPRDQIVIVGIPCDGMADTDRLVPSGESLVGVAVAQGADGNVTVTSGTGQRTLFAADILQERCRLCEYNTPAVADEMLGEPAPRMPGAGAPFAGVAELERLSPAERQAFWHAQLERCLRCYACREACPACYCRSCFADKAAPRWLSKANAEDENWMFHASRAFHLAGRCVECGECERACPMGIPISRLNRMLDRDIRERFGYVAGLDPAAVPPLGTFRPDDREPGGHEG